MRRSKAMRAAAAALLVVQVGAVGAQELVLPDLDTRSSPAMAFTTTSAIAGAARGAGTAGAAAMGGSAAARSSGAAARAAQTRRAVRARQAVRGANTAQRARNATRGVVTRSNPAVRQARIRSLRKLLKAMGAAGGAAGMGGSAAGASGAAGASSAAGASGAAGAAGAATKAAVVGKAAGAAGVPGATNATNAAARQASGVANEAQRQRRAGASATRTGAAASGGAATRTRAAPEGRAATRSAILAKVQKKAGLSGKDLSKLQAYMKRSPLYQSAAMPFAPSNILFAVGATAGMTLLGQAGGEEGLDVGSAFSFLGDSSFWGGLVGSGVGYALASVVATSLFPAGVGVFAATMPLFAGMAGSILGWELGSGFFAEGGFREALANLSPGRLLGQAAGTTAGLLVGANLAAALGGALGAFAGPVGAIAGALVLGDVGAKVGEALTAAFTGDSGQLDAALKDAGKAVGEVAHLAELMPSADLDGSALATEGLPAKLVAEYRAGYEELRQALVAEDRARAAQQIRYLRRLEQAYDAEIAAALRQMAGR